MTRRKVFGWILVSPMPIALILFIIKLGILLHEGGGLIPLLTILAICISTIYGIDLLSEPEFKRDYPHSEEDNTLKTMHEENRKEVLKDESRSGHRSRRSD